MYRYIYTSCTSSLSEGVIDDPSCITGSYIAQLYYTVDVLFMRYSKIILFFQGDAQSEIVNTQHSDARSEIISA